MNLSSEGEMDSSAASSSKWSVEPDNNDSGADSDSKCRWSLLTKTEMDPSAVSDSNYSFTTEGEKDPMAASDSKYSFTTEGEMDSSAASGSKWSVEPDNNDSGADSDSKCRWSLLTKTEMDPSAVSDSNYSFTTEGEKDSMAASDSKYSFTTEGEMDSSAASGSKWSVEPDNNDSGADSDSKCRWSLLTKTEMDPSAVSDSDYTFTTEGEKDSSAASDSKYSFTTEGEEKESRAASDRDSKYSFTTEGEKDSSAASDSMYSLTTDTEIEKDSSAALDNMNSFTTKVEKDSSAVSDSKWSSTDCESSGSSDEESGEEVEIAEASDTIVSSMCLFCTTTHDDAGVILNQHMKTAHKFNFKNMCLKYNISDQIQYIKFINYCRSFVAEKADPGVPIREIVLSIELQPVSETIRKLEDHYIPTIPNDGLLQYFYEQDEDDYDTNESRPGTTGTGLDLETKDEWIQILQNENKLLREETEKTNKHFLEDISKMREVMSRMVQEDNSNSITSRVKRSMNLNPSNSNKFAEEERWYFESYDDVEVHFDMLNDKARTLAYMNSILKNKADFEGKTILDLGCGTGILSMFSAQAGAKHVYAVDKSKIVIDAMDIVNENGLSKTITCMSGAIEDISTLQSEKVDILVSEWMGYFLLFEGMLSSYLYARDYVLKEGGLMFPNKASIYLVGSDDQANYDSFYRMWDNVYGFRMSAMKKRCISQGIVEEVEKDKIVTDSFELLSLDLTKCRAEDAVINQAFVLKAAKDCKLTSLVGYFDVSFSMGTTYSQTLATGPSDPLTHWKQTRFYLPNMIPLKQGESLHGHFWCNPDKKNPRSLKIKITLGEERYYYDMK